MKRILIVAAPFGLGPAAKAFILASALCEGCKVSVLSAGHAAVFLKTYLGSQISVFDGQFRAVFPDRTSLDAYDGFVCIGQVPALMHLIGLGLGKKSIFVDSTSQWRQQVTNDVHVFSQAGDHNDVAEDARGYKIAAHLIEDELLEAGNTHVTTHAGIRVSPIILRKQGQSSNRDIESFVFHTGGLYSPAVDPKWVGLYIDRLLLPLLQVIAGFGRPLTVLGPVGWLESWLRSPNVSFAGEVNPHESFRLISTASVLITTPGLGAIYEAISNSVPVIMLPPMNSTQIQHHRLWCQYGVPSLMHPEIVDLIPGHVLTLPWHKHANAVMELLAATSSFHVDYGSRVLASLLSPEMFYEFVSKARFHSLSLWSGLSQRDPILEIKGAIENLA